jgi:hypothetical protein
MFKISNTILNKNINLEFKRKLKNKTKKKITYKNRNAVNFAETPLIVDDQKISSGQIYVAISYSKYI